MKIIGLTGSIQIDPHLNLGFLGVAVNFGNALCHKNILWMKSGL
jgi:hypothetical protein